MHLYIYMLYNAFFPFFKFKAQSSTNSLVILLWYMVPYFLQNLTGFRAPVTQAVRIRSCFFSQNSIMAGRTQYPRQGRSWMMAFQVQKDWGGIASNGGQHLRRSCTRLMRGRRTPAKRREKLWWRNATGTNLFIFQILHVLVSVWCNTDSSLKTNCMFCRGS